MAATPTPGITVDACGHRIIEKRHRSIRIGMRVGDSSQEQAEQRLHVEIERVDVDLARRTRARPLFHDCAAR
jgi:hypothetical protein